MSAAANAPLPALFFAACITLALAGCAFSVDLDGDATRRIQTEVVPAAGLAGVDVATSNGAVEIRAADVEEIEVRSILRESDEGDAIADIDIDGDRLVVRGDCDSGWFNQCSVGFRIEVPHTVDVAVATDNGAIDVVAVGGDLDLETDNGAITADRLLAPEATVRTDNGRIHLDFARPPFAVDAATDNGAVTIRVPDDGEAYDVDAASDNGGVDVDVIDDPAAERRIVAESDNGSIDVEYLSATP